MPEPTSARVPLEIVVAPLKPLMLSRVSVPLPCLVSPPLPQILPLKVVEFAVPTVSVLAPSMMNVPATPLRSWIVWPPLLAEMSKVTPVAASATPLDVAILPLPDSARVPPEIVVAPV